MKFLDLLYLPLYLFFFFNWNNLDVCLKRKQDPCGKYLSIHSLSLQFLCKIPNLLGTIHNFHGTDQRYHY